MDCLSILAALIAKLEPVETSVPTPKPTPKPEDNSPWVPDAYEEEYKNLYETCVVRAGQESTVQYYVNKIKMGQKRYESFVANNSLKIPWQIVAIIHVLEGNADWKACLHNGEKIIGTGKKTTLVPKGRGPFATWEAAALDALDNDKFKQVPNWTLVECLYFGERFNGLGHRGKKDKFGKPIYTPYLWGLSNHHLYGKYVADHVYSPSATTKQAGMAVLMRQLGMFV